MLATQNPVDLDYKGLSNTGTWFIGRLQTERDKARLLDGLEGAAAETGVKFKRSEMEETLAGLGQRVFLMNNVHDDKPVVFESRWAMSYLRGPLTRDQIKMLMDPRRAEILGASRATSIEKKSTTGEAERSVIAAATVRFSDAKSKIDTEKNIVYSAPIDGRLNAPDWAKSSDAVVQDGNPPAPNLLKAWRSDLLDWLANHETLELFRCDEIGIASQAGETERDFRAHAGQLLREQRDRDVAALRAKYAAKIGMLEDRIRRAQGMKEKQKEQAVGVGLSTVLQIGGSLLGAFFGGGRKPSVTKIVTAARAAGRTYEETQDVNRADDNVEALAQQLQEVNAQVEAEILTLQASADPSQIQIEKIVIRPKKTAIAVKSILIVPDQV